MTDLHELMALADIANEAIEESKKNPEKQAQKEICRFCKNADKEALKQGKPYCASKYILRDDFCLNFF